MNIKEREKYIEEFDFPHCDDATKYEKVAKIGQGTFGEVFKAKERKNPKKFVAMKKVLMDNEKEGFPITALREIRILQLLKHENVVNLIEICRTKANAVNKYRSTFYLVFDFCEHDLAGLLSNVNVKFNLGEIKKVMQQLLNGLYYIHSNKILHRDMKAANVLITKNGVLKLADFGLARAFSISKNGTANRYTNRVVTLWYRPPELLLGDRNYGPPVDLWGAGCIMAEMWTRSPIMQGNTEQQQLTLISQLCGSITTDVWPGVENLDLFSRMELPRNQKRKVRERLKPYVKDPYACDLLDKLLILDPSKRIDSDSALNHDFFWCDPMPGDLSKMLAQHTQSMFEYTAPQEELVTCVHIIIKQSRSLHMWTQVTKTEFSEYRQLPLMHGASSDVRREHPRPSWWVSSREGSAADMNSPLKKQKFQAKKPTQYTPGAGLVPAEAPMSSLTPTIPGISAVSQPTLPLPLSGGPAGLTGRPLSLSWGP